MTSTEAKAGFDTVHKGISDDTPEESHDSQTNGADFPLFARAAIPQEERVDAAAVLLPHSWASREISRLILGWNSAAWLYLVLSGWMMAHADHSQIHRRARQQDEGAKALLALVVISALASLGAIVAELSVAKSFTGSARMVHFGLALITVLASWAFTQVMFALHYAHDYYAAVSHGRSGGLLFPETEHPDYLDFLYLAAVIGTSGQTADVAFTGSAIRRIGLVHCVLAFVFNTSLIGLMVNVASSLL